MFPSHDPDGRKITFLEKPNIILDVQELNVLPIKDQFEIEVFQIVDPTEKNKDFLRKLYFTSQIEDDNELDKIPIQNRVETYFEINFDDSVVLPFNSSDQNLLDRAILENRLNEYYNNKIDSRVTIFENGINITEDLNSESDYNPKNSNEIRNNLINRDQIGVSLYDLFHFQI